jgi:sec-independent protein translocase protein TatA
MLGGIGMPELLVILVIILIVFGAGKLPDIGGGLGKAIKNFKKATNEQTETPVTKQSTDELEDKTHGAKS